MDDLDIDETLPGQEIEEKAEDIVIRRENSTISQGSFGERDVNLDSSDIKEQESLRGWLYLVAGVH